jgi:DNA topoisomerase-3
MPEPLELVVGMNATRLYTVKHGGYKQVLSVGRVQTLHWQWDRFAIENFKPQPYWELQTLYRHPFSYEEGAFLKKEDEGTLSQ